TSRPTAFTSVRRVAPRALISGRLRADNRAARIRARANPMAHADEEASDRTPAPPPGHRPDWLVGAEEGLEAELEGRERQLPTPQLRRPGAPPGEVVQPKAPAAAPLERPPAPPQPPRSRLPELDDLDLTGLGLGGG